MSKLHVDAARSPPRFQSWDSTPSLGGAQSQGTSSGVLQEARGAATLLQRNFRRGRWTRLVKGAVASGLPLVRGPCGFIAFPIFNKGHLDGIEGHSGRRYMHTVGHMPPNHPLRLCIIAVVDSPWFERASLLVVGLNCFVLAAEGPPVSGADGYGMEFAFTIAFTIEFLLRSLTMGFAGHKWSYMGDRWNWIDFFVVAMSWLPLLLPGLDNLSSMRGMRALRPLRIINRFPGMRRQVITLIDSIPQMLGVATLLMFFLIVYGVLGVQLFAGVLHYRCFGDVGGDVGELVFGLKGASGQQIGVQPVEALTGVCASATPGSQGTCDAGKSCRWYEENPLFGTVSFDNIVSAFLTLLQCITLEGWVDVMYMLSKTAGPISVVYLVSLVVLGSFYMLNLFIAVMWSVYQSHAVKLTPEAKPPADRRRPGAH